MTSSYKKDPDNPKKIIPNEDTAPVVKHIFELCAKGYGPSKIARILEEEKILKPTVYDYQTNGTNHTHLKLENPYKWVSRTIIAILEMEEYIGTTVNLRTYTPSFKSKKYKHIPPEKWIRFENTHEPLVDRETWDIVQKVRSSKRRPTKMGEQDIFSGLVECATCGKKHYFCRAGSLKKEQFTFACSTYRNSSRSNACTAHSVRVVALHELVLLKINQTSQEAKSHREQFLKKVMDKHNEQFKKDLLAKQRELDKSQKRLSEVDKIFCKTFEQMALGTISDEQFKMLTNSYDAEKVELTSKVEILQHEIVTGKDKMQGADRFMKLVDKYTDIQELTPEIVREFIDKIVVHERSEPYKRKNYSQEIDVYFNFIGKM